MIFITKLVAYSVEPEKDFARFIRFLKIHSGTATDDTNLIRVMVPLFDIIEVSTLAEIFQNFKPKIWQLINNKFGIYLIQKIVERGVDVELKDQNTPEQVQAAGKEKPESIISARKWIENICL